MQVHEDLDSDSGIGIGGWNTSFTASGTGSLQSDSLVMSIPCVPGPPTGPNTRSKC